MAAVPIPPQAPADATDELLELKTLHFGASTYPLDMEQRCAAVDRRARALPAEALRKARRLDQQHCRTPAGQVGPVERRLVSYGP
eukprot:12415197-Karenia_brevis.AAC.1